MSFSFETPVLECIKYISSPSSNVESPISGEDCSNFFGSTSDQYFATTLPLYNRACPCGPRNWDVIVSLFHYHSIDALHLWLYCSCTPPSHPQCFAISPHVSILWTMPQVAPVCWNVTRTWGLYACQVHCSICVKNRRLECSLWCTLWYIFAQVQCMYTNYSGAFFQHWVHEEQHAYTMYNAVPVSTLAESSNWNQLSAKSTSVSQ